MREIQGFESMKRENRKRNRTSEVVIIKKQRLEIEETREIRYSSGERVVLETENTKLIEI
jgi:hypothetical protein